MAHGITGIDHTLIGVSDLEAAAAVYRRLGFTLTPRGRHIGWGTANHCIMFPDSYVELLGITDPQQFTNGLDQVLAERGDGMLGIALGTQDAALAYEELARTGLNPVEPRRLSRTLELAEGPAMPEFKLVHLPPETTPALSAFVCEHCTPELLRRPEWVVHPNSAQGIAAVTVVAEEPGRLAAAYDLLFGAGAATMTDDTLAVLAGRSMILFVTPTDLEMLYPSLGGDDEVPMPYIAAMSLTVADATETARCLDRTGVRFKLDREKVVRVPPGEACGVLLEFTERVGSYARYWDEARV